MVPSYTWQKKYIVYVDLVLSKVMQGMLHQFTLELLLSPLLHTRCRTLSSLPPTKFFPLLHCLINTALLVPTIQSCCPTSKRPPWLVIVSSLMSPGMTMSCLWHFISKCIIIDSVLTLRSCFCCVL